MKHLVAVTSDEIALLRRALQAAESPAEFQALGDELERRALDGESVITALTGASHALRSYQHGNAAPDLAEEIADACDEALSIAERPIGLSAGLSRREHTRV